MKTLLSPLNEINAFRGAKECIEKKKLPVHISGCIDTQKCHFIYGMSEGIPWKVIVTGNEIRAREIVEDYRIFEREVMYYPAKDVIFYSADIQGNALRAERLRVVNAILERDGGTVVTTMDAGMEMVQELNLYKKNIVEIKPEDIIDLDKLCEKLILCGYERQAQVSSSGEFSVRGGIIDIFPVTEECPYRIELWDDEVDTIRSFDVESQRSIERVEKLKIFPAVELIISGNELKKGIERMEADRKKLVSRFREQKNHDALNNTAKLVENIKENIELYHGNMGLESYISYFDINTESFFDYFDIEKTVFFVDEASRCAEKMDTVWFEFSESMESRLGMGYLLPGQMEVLFPSDRVIGNISRKQTIFLSTLDTLPRGISAHEQFHIQVQSIGTYNKHFELLAEDIRKWRENGCRVLILSASRTRAKRIAGDLNEYDLPAFYREKPDILLNPGEIMVSYGYLHRGFSYTAQHFVVVSESDVFGAQMKKKRGRQKKYDGKSVGSFHELSVGDYVVHENHGLGVYRGIEKIRVDNITKDFLKVEYGDGGILYVSASGLDVLQKYAGHEAEKVPKLNKLGGAEWKKTKSRVRGAVKEIAGELVELYAKRQQQKGFAFGADTVWQHEFEELFPFEETHDQLAAIEDVKRDMESTKIMDRLICGDVGYGKTEIALRAAFKAVNDGKQVAVLVPTTILAQQHYNTLKERLGDFPVSVDMLSRFRTQAQQKKAVANLKKGQLDIVIGTHRLLSKDIAFKDLGLLIVDEEQRFGVTHKEKIKQMKGNVDVLTLSATPIPRTLHMSLVGIRDMSVLEEPPVDRQPIQTFVMEYNTEMIREAINREVARGGQVYYVSNRVRGIEDKTAMIAELVPDANVAFAHGQMSERQLENIMLSFINKEIDVLVATTIIETGLDISNVNTMIIDNADQMGLSQLYQLRGRVGRSNRTAYAFLMYKRDKMLKEVAQKRLEAIKEFTELGSGIKVAMRDLEIRGAGNILGASQSGHMEAVGYDLYCKMLNEAIRKMKGDDTETDEFETLMDLRVDAFIPSSYIKSEFVKLDIYKRIAGIETLEEYSNLQDELIDRFGDIPAAADNLLRIALLKSDAHSVYITQIVQKENEIRFYLYPKANVVTQNIPKLLEVYQGKLKFASVEEPYFRYEIKEKEKKGLTSDKIFHIVKEVITGMGGLV